MHKARTFKPPKVHNLAYYSIGLLFLFLNKIRHSIKGYKTPRTFPITEFQKAIEYDFAVVANWLQYLKQYLGAEADLKDKTILELGPGSDLGVGIITLSKGAKKYNAIDANDLVKFVPDQFYEELFMYIENIKDKEVDTDFLRSQLHLTKLGNNDKLNYLYRKDFDITVFEKENIDLVFSQAAFEHFGNVEKTICELSKITKPGVILIAEVDLRTHTRWIRDLDPVNIYRYSDFIYNMFKFSGSPNRLRPCEYKEILKKNEWVNIQVLPLTILEGKYLLKIKNALNKRFQDISNQMNYLSIMICATKD